MIREMRPEDWDRVVEIYKQGIERGVSTFNTTCPSYEVWDHAHLKVCRFVAEIERDVAGWVAISAVSSRPVYQGVVEVSIYIDERYQGKGIGSTLLTKLCEASEKAGYWSLYSVIFSMNTSSIALHKKCGFREIGYREKVAKDRFGKWQNTTLMERRNDII